MKFFKLFLTGCMVFITSLAFAQGGSGIGTYYQTFKERTTNPSTPGATYHRLFFESTGLSQIDSTGAKIPISGVSLLSTTTVTLASNGEQTIYTVPTGKRCILIMAVLVVGADANSTDFTIGSDGAETDWLGTQQTDNLNAANDVGVFMPVPNAVAVLGKSYAAGTLIKFTVANQAGGATNTLYLFGILY